MTTSIVIAEDHHLVRQALANLLNAEPAFEVTGEVDDGREAIALVRKSAPDVMLIDLVMPELNGLDAIRAIGRLGVATRCLALSSSVESRTVVKVMEAGGWGYVPKSIIYTQLIEAIRSVVAGQKWLSPAVTDGFVQHCLVHSEGGNGTGNGSGNGEAAGGSRRRKNGGRNGSGHATRSSSNVLTPREREVLQLLSEGRASKQIAAELHLSVKTVDSHRAALMRKLELHSVADLTKYAVREGITPLS